MICTVCRHPSRETIDIALIALEPCQAVAARYSLGERSVARHKASCLFASLAKSQEARDALRLDGLLDRIRFLEAKVDGVLAKAEKDDNPGMVLRAVREARENLVVLAKLLGELQEAGAVHIHLAPEWILLRAQILVALAGHSEARQAVLEALDELGS